MTVDEVAVRLGLTGNAIRLQLAALERDGLIQRSGTRRGTSKPAQIYALSPEAELMFSRAYPPILTELLHVLSAKVAPADFDALMREVGSRLLVDRPRPIGTAPQRAQAASKLLNELGGLARVEERDGGLVIRSDGCPLAAATLRHPEACNAVESLLAEFTGLLVRKCCDREERPRCCFEVSERV